MNNVTEFTRGNNLGQKLTLSTDKTLASSFLRTIFNWMAIGLLITGLCSWAFSSILIQRGAQLGNLALIGLGAMIADIILVFSFARRIHTMRPTQARLFFLIHSVLEGIGLSYIFLVYTVSSIATTFFVCATTFAVMSLYGMSTKTDLTKMRSYFIMGFIGLLIMSVVNWIIASSALYWFISTAGVVLFCGITAYDVQMLLRLGDDLKSADQASYKKYALFGALKLHLDFIGLFLYLLRFLGKRN